MVSCCAPSPKKSIFDERKPFTEKNTTIRNASMSPNRFLLQSSVKSMDRLVCVQLATPTISKGAQSVVENRQPSHAPILNKSLSTVRRQNMGTNTTIPKSNTRGERYMLISFVPNMAHSLKHHPRTCLGVEVVQDALLNGDTDLRANDSPGIARSKSVMRGYI